MKELIELSEAYLDAPSTDYALMVDGLWGSGKTFFWKNTLAPLIEASKSPTGESTLRTVYVSLYGITRPEDIAREVYFAIHPKLGTKYSKLAGGAGRLVMKFLRLDPDSLKIDPKDWTNLDNVVLCFDDLERCRVPVSDTLGNINQYVEHEGLKTFILCNEKGIRDSDQSEYRRIKEKVVGRTVKFKPDLKAVYGSLVPLVARTPRYREFLTKSQDTVVDLFERSGSGSLRVLKQGLYNLGRVFDAVAADAAFKERAQNDLVRLVLPLSFEYGTGEATDEQVRQLATQGMALFAASLVRGDEGKEDYYTKYAERFFDGNLPTLPSFSAVATLITTGVYDATLLPRELDDAYARGSELDLALAALFGNYYQLSDDDFRAHWGKARKAVLDDAINSMPMLYKLYAHAMYWAQLGVIELSREQVAGLFREAVVTGLEAKSFEYDDDLSEHLSMTMTEGDPEVQGFRDFLIERNNDLRKASDEQQGHDFLSALAEQPDNMIKRLVHDLYAVPLMDVLPADRFAESILGLPNRSKTLLSHAIERRYLKDPPREATCREHQGLRRVASALRARLTHDPAKPKPVSDVILTQVATKMEQAADRLAPTATHPADRTGDGSAPSSSFGGEPSEEKKS